MAVFNGFFPILTSDDAVREFVAELMGPRKAGWDALHERTGITRETWALQPTQNGLFILVWFESSAVENAFAGLAQDDSDFAIWYKAEVLARTGVDFNAPPSGPLPATALDWTP